MNSAWKLSWWIDIEQPGDIAGIGQVHQSAFHRPDEAELVDRLRQASLVFISLVARCEALVLGHVLFTPARILQADRCIVTGLALGPLAVLPEYQHQGIGSALCREGLSRIDPESYPFVIVLGHPDYYPRFGFEPASQYGIYCSYLDEPKDSFMIRILDADKMSDVTGTAFYHPEFDSVS